MLTITSKSTLVPRAFYVGVITYAESQSMDQSMKYLNSAIASEGGTTWLALEDESGTLYELKLDKKIGSPTSDRLYVNEALLDPDKESSWVQLLQETISKSSFEHEGEKEMIEHVISSLVARK